MSALAVRGWIGPGARRLDVAVAAGDCAEAAVPDPRATLRRVAGLAAPRLWVRVGADELGRLPAVARARAGLATVDGALPAARELRVIDAVMAGRPLPGRLGFLGAFTDARAKLAQEREADARALAGVLGLGPLLEDPVAGLDRRAAAVADVARALLAEPRALVAALPPDEEAAAWLRARLAVEARRRGLPVLLLSRERAG
ncbi:MAG TPA: hypothetical protein VNU01_03880 [Egibacteraceae bacterium]|nr:hypothetical protein [Egibacteraceae bacterium]